jgi:predicted enzyme related to lactoylglutathione lyase
MTSASAAPVRARSLAWLGVPTDDVDAAAAFFARQLGVGLEHRDGDFAILRLSSGQAIELFGPSLRGQPQFQMGPVVGFEVDDVVAVRAEMEAAGVHFIGPVHRGDAGAAWSHFTGPDGQVYELTQLARSR